MFTNRFLSHKIDYTIHSYSSYSSTYYPSNIKTDLPHDPTSRWSSSSNDQKQYLILELNKPTIVTSITFGKFSKIHVCNVKEIKVLSSPFRVDGGNSNSNYFSKDSIDRDKDSIDKDYNIYTNNNTYHITNLNNTHNPNPDPNPNICINNTNPNPNPNICINNTNPNPNICINKDIFSLPFIEVLHTSLYNDTEKETFLLKVTNKNTFILTKYIKIIPLQAWGMNFNYSIWFIGLYGIDMCKCVIPLHLQYKQYQSVRLILKYLQRNEVKGGGDICRDSVRGDNDIGCDIKGDNDKDSDIKGNNNSTSQIKGDNNKDSDIKGNSIKDSVGGDSIKDSNIKGDNNSTSQIKGNNNKDSDIKGNNNSTTQIKGNNNSTSHIRGDNDIGCDIKGDNNLSSNLDPFNNSTNKQHPLNNSTDKQQGVNDLSRNLDPLSNSTDKQQGVNNTSNTSKQHPLNNTRNTNNPNTNPFNIQLQHPLLSTLYSHLNTKKFKEAEYLIKNIKNCKYFKDYINKTGYKIIWYKIPYKEIWPGSRGGHHGVIHKGYLYMYGGWNGTQELCDMWRYRIKGGGEGYDSGGGISKDIKDYNSNKDNSIDNPNPNPNMCINNNNNNANPNPNMCINNTNNNVNTSPWYLLSTNTKTQNGPGRRSCHKMCINPLNDSIYVLGRYLPTEYQRESTWLSSDMYRYDIKSDIWEIEVEGDSSISSRQQGDSSISSRQQGDSNSISRQQGVSSSNSNSRQHPVSSNNSISSRQHPVSINSSSTDSLQGVSNSSSYYSSSNSSNTPLYISTVNNTPLSTSSTNSSNNTPLSNSSSNNTPITTYTNTPITTYTTRPDNIYDHQMIFYNNITPSFFIYGGRSMLNDTQGYSGLYLYEIISKKWRCIRNDNEQPEFTPWIRGRVGHSVIYIPKGYSSSISSMNGSDFDDMDKDSSNNNLISNTDTNLSNTINNLITTTGTNESNTDNTDINLSNRNQSNTNTDTDNNTDNNNNTNLSNTNNTNTTNNNNIFSCDNSCLFGNFVEYGEVKRAVKLLLKDYDDSLVIIGGQRGKEIFKSMTFYKIESDSVYDVVDMNFIGGDDRVVVRSVLNGRGEIVCLVSNWVEECMDVYVYRLEDGRWCKCEIEDEFYDIYEGGDIICSRDRLDRDGLDRDGLDSDGLDDRDKLEDIDDREYIRGRYGKYNKDKRYVRDKQGRCDKDRNNMCVGGKDKVPMARSAHVFLYDKDTDSYYLYGGNVSTENGDKRVSDMWRMKMKGIEMEKIKMRIVFLIRKYKFMCLLGESIEEALKYLRSEVCECVDHSDKEMVGEFRGLCCEIYKPVRCVSVCEVIEEIGVYFNKSMCMPSENIEDFV